MKHFNTAHISFRVIAMVLGIAVAISSISYYVFNINFKGYASIVDCPLKNVLPEIAIKLNTKPYHLPLIRAIEIDNNNPEDIQFYFDTMNTKIVTNKEMHRMIKYFLGFLAMPEDKLWVNLSPYEKDRVIPESLLKLDIGKDMLLEDYLLKVLVSSLTNPKTKQGKLFWEKVFKVTKAYCKIKKIP